MHSSFSFVDIDKTTRFCLKIDEDEKETIQNGLMEAGLDRKHLTQLKKNKILLDYHVEDCTLHIRLYNSFLSEAQMRQSLWNEKQRLEHVAKMEAEEVVKKHAEKCVNMHDKLLKALEPFGKFAKEVLHNSHLVNKSQDVYAYNNAKITTDDLRAVEKVLAQAEVKSK